MIEVKAYKTDCGKLYAKKQSALEHESICKCWSNPNLKTCLTCKFGELINDSNGMENEPQFLQTWRWWNCKNPLWDYDTMFTQAPNDKTDSLCINCQTHELK